MMIIKLNHQPAAALRDCEIGLIDRSQPNALLNFRGRFSKRVCSEDSGELVVPPAYKHDQRGVTFVEVLVTMALLSGFLLILSSLLTSSIDMQLQTGSYAAVTSDGRFVLSRLGYDIRRASSVTPAALGDSSSSLVLTIGGSTYTYSIDSGRLKLDIDGNGDFLTGDKTVISSLSFQKLGNVGGKASIRYSFTVTGQADHKPDIQAYTDTTEMR